MTKEATGSAVLTFNRVPFEEGNLREKRVAGLRCRLSLYLKSPPLVHNHQTLVPLLKSLPPTVVFGFALFSQDSRDRLHSGTERGTQTVLTQWKCLVSSRASLRIGLRTGRQ